jgi:hypothetical protein
VATFYIDPDSGSDAAAGTSFALAWRTITSGATAARIAPGDVIRIKASPAPTSVGNATWTNAALSLTLAGAVTANIDRCESAWTPSANVTATAEGTTRKEGTNSSSLAIAAGFTTGLVAYSALAGATDFSSYQQVSFWIRASATVAASTLTLTLCSDAVGATPVNTIAIPAIGVANVWLPVTVDTGGALGASIQSVALNALLDPGAVTILLDNILACKAPGSADSLTLHSFIGKNLTTESWHPIKAINGTSVFFDADPRFNVGSARGYAGTTETVTTYKRECFVQTPAASASTVVADITDSGTDGSPITYSGGWDRTDMSTQLSGTDGESWFDYQTANGRALQCGTRSFINIERLAFCRVETGFYSANGSSTGGYINLTRCSFVGCQNGIDLRISPATLDTVHVPQCGVQNLIYNTGNINLFNCIFDGNQNASGLVLNGTAKVNAYNVKARQHMNYGFVITNGAMGYLRSCFTEGNGTGAILVTGPEYTGSLDMSNCTLSESTEVTSASQKVGTIVRSHNHDGVAGAHRTFMEGGQIASESGADRRTTGAGALAWKLSPTSTNRNSSWPVSLPIARVYCEANAAVTVSAWFKRDNSGITGRLMCRGYQIAGVNSDVTDTTAGAAGSYEELEITFTPTEAGVVEIEAQAYGGTTYNVWVDDADITQA